MYGDWGEGCVGVIIGSNTMGGGGGVLKVAIL